jgi:dTDP-glucose 4,6-dehydratase
MRKILVTGVDGFISSHITEALVRTGYEVRAFVLFNSFKSWGWLDHRVPDVKGGFEVFAGDIRDPYGVRTATKGCDAVLHLAGKTFVQDSWADPAGFMKCKLLGTIAALNYCKNNNAGLIFLSSYMDENPKSLPIPETAPLVANNPNALSKKLAENGCLFYSDSYGIHITILRQENAGKFIKVKDLEPKRDHVYVSDVVQSILKTVDCKRSFGIFNIGSGVGHSVEKPIRIIQSLKRTDLPMYVDAE